MFHFSRAFCVYDAQYSLTKFVRRPRKGRKKNDDEYFHDTNAKNFGYFSEQQFNQLNSQVNTYKLILNQVQQYHHAMNAIFY